MKASRLISKGFWALISLIALGIFGLLFNVVMARTHWGLYSDLKYSQPKYTIMIIM